MEGKTPTVEKYNSCQDDWHIEEFAGDCVSPKCKIVMIYIGEDAEAYPSDRISSTGPFEVEE